MFTIDETEDMLNEIANELPEEFFRHLNGGIALKEAAKRHPKSCADDLYILGEYRVAGPLGRYHCDLLWFCCSELRKLFQGGLQRSFKKNIEA